jgi:hypothetical protein
MKTALLSLLTIAAAIAQEQTGRIEGVVIDAASHQPVKKATIFVNFLGPQAPDAHNQAPSTATTDASGAFAFSNLATGRYEVIVQHQNYPQAGMRGARKTVQVAAGETAPSVTVELIPGATVSGRVVDEDGDPLSGCIMQPHPAKNFNQGVPIVRMPSSHEDGPYRIYGIPPGKYTITAQCSESVFQPRPLSEGPDPAPTSAYPTLFYPAAYDVNSAEVVDLSPGAEKSGVDFQMRPVAVTHIRGILTAGTADWRGRTDLQVQLIPLDPHSPLAFALSSGQIDPKDGSFELHRVFPGSYRLIAFSQNFSARGPQPDAGSRVGAAMRVDAANKPIQVSLQLQRAVDIPGSVEIERGNDSANEVTPSQINIQLRSENQIGAPPAPTQVNDDGSFTIKSVLPGEWRIMLMAPSAFLKSAWLGNTDITHVALDLTSGSVAPLRIVVGTNTATIRGTAPAGQMVFAMRIDDNDPAPGWRGGQLASNGQFTIQLLAPGRYRVTVGDMEGPMPEDVGQEITLAEGENAAIDVKPETRP